MGLTVVSRPPVGVPRSSGPGIGGSAVHDPPRARRIVMTTPTYLYWPPTRTSCTDHDDMLRGLLVDGHPVTRARGPRIATTHPSPEPAFSSTLSHADELCGTALYGIPVSRDERLPCTGSRPGRCPSSRSCEGYARTFTAGCSRTR